MKIYYPQHKETVNFAAENRQTWLAQLEKTRYDLCIIGGGINGAAIARDASMRGLKTVLIEKGDFSSGTSSKSSKLIHGGFRYLKQCAFGLVHESLVERYKLLHLAPHLVKRLPCVFPIYKGAKDGYWWVCAGMWAYDILCGSKIIGRHRMWSRGKALAMVPTLRAEKFKGAARYFDAVMDDFRLTLANLQSAVLAGCHALNYVRATAFVKQNSKIEAVSVHDEIAGQDYNIRARSFVNACGPWSDEVRRLADPNAKQQVRTTMGIHLILPRERLPLTHALMILSLIDERPIFVIPWQNFTLFGTTDTDYKGDLDKLAADKKDVEYLLNCAHYYFPAANLTESDIISSFTGLRPLVYEEGKSASQVSREHKIFESPSNVFNIIGGKYTTHRRIASDVLRYIAGHVAELKIPDHCPTEEHPVYGGETRNFAKFLNEKGKAVQQQYQLSGNISDYLINTYGFHVDDVLAYLAKDACLKQAIVPGLPYVWAELPYAVQHEMACTLEDFLMRRLHVLWFARDNGRAVVQEAADKMGALLGWSAQEKERQVAQYLVQVKLAIEFRK
jgi:glycerol-3-phosphate dehydrogenase